MIIAVEVVNGSGGTNREGIAAGMRDHAKTLRSITNLTLAQEIKLASICSILEGLARDAETGQYSRGRLASSRLPISHN